MGFEGKKNREITWKGEQEPPTYFAYKKETFEKPKEAAPATPETLELRGYLEKIDFKTLRSIFEEEYVRCGLDPREMNFFEADQIENGGFLSYGSYEPAENKLKLNIRAIEGSLEKEYDHVRPDLYVSYLLSHEMTHALSRVMCGFSSGEVYSMTNVGYAKTEHRREGFSDNRFEEFNEGVTDLIAGEVLDEYAKRTGTFSDDDIRELKVPLALSHPYWTARDKARTFVQKLAEVSQLPYETVWEAVKVGVFRGDILYEGELREWLEGELGQGYVETASKDTERKPVRPKRSSPEQVRRDITASILRLKRTYWDKV